MRFMAMPTIVTLWPCAFQPVWTGSDCQRILRDALLGPSLKCRDQPLSNPPPVKTRLRVIDRLQGAVAALSRPKTLAGASGSTCEDEIDKRLKPVYD
jgi:hypothetical protein